jgi:hypothetical protein
MSQENSPEDVRASVTDAALQEKFDQPKVKAKPGPKPKSAQTIESSVAVKVLDSMQEVWIRAFVAAMSNLQVKHVDTAGFDKCGGIADATVNEFKKRFK